MRLRVLDVEEPSLGAEDAGELGLGSEDENEWRAVNQWFRVVNPGAGAFKSTQVKRREP
jgi:hypothetical protein